MKTCIATIPSLNICIKAQKSLLNNGIYSKIVSLDPQLTRRGCAYGVEFPCTEEKTVRQILRRAGIGVSQFISSEGGNLL